MSQLARIAVVALVLVAAAPAPHAQQSIDDFTMMLPPPTMPIPSSPTLMDFTAGRPS